MLLLEDGLGSEEITVGADLALVIVQGISQQTGLRLSKDSLTTILGWLIVAQVNTLRLRQEGRIETLIPVSSSIRVRLREIRLFLAVE